MYLKFCAPEMKQGMRPSLPRKREREGERVRKREVGRVENIILSQLPRCDERNGDDKWGTRTLKKVADDEF